MFVVLFLYLCGDDLVWEVGGGVVGEGAGE